MYLTHVATYTCYLIMIKQHVTKVALWFLIYSSNNGNGLPGHPHAILLTVSTKPLRLAIKLLSKHCFTT